MAKNMMLVNRRAPCGTIFAWEGLEVALIAGAFEQCVSVAFIGDGVLQLKRGQDARALEMKNTAAALGALGHHDVRAIYVEAESLAARGLARADLIDVEGLDGEACVRVVPRAELARLIRAQDVLLPF